MAGINSHIIHKEVTGSNVSRRKFLLSLAEELAQINESTQEQVISSANSQLSRKNVKLKECNGNKSVIKCSICNKVCGPCMQTTYNVCKNC